ncbi:iron complex outermembrane receptor protein [Pedobacter africanus]|uniref:Iron complex outermembrane receptor protein n=1 Tax=Pedobacter africanus TaxID=151894 RepID=A0ACC6KUG8_9SPHI|nr:TonB-dependent receptor [Pedobacter africanus]MDR6782746.1 iron complex outermembrane receptor protein [Pedobacter africanus]
MRILYTALSLIGLALFSPAAFAQLTLSGKITDKNSKPIPGATIKLIEKKIVQVTDQDGTFEFPDLAPGTYNFTTSYIGYDTRNTRFNLQQGKTYLIVVLQDKDNELQGVEITGRKEQAYKNTKSFSGTKTETPLRYVPQAISYVTKEVIDDQQAFKASDVIRNISGATHFSYYNNDISLRGFRSGNALINGLRTPTSSWSQPLLPNVERIEVIKGPASALFANTDPGGTVNTVTKKPLDEARKSINFATGSYNTNRLMADFTGPMNESKTLLYRLNLAYQNAESFRVLQGGEDLVIAPSISFIPDDKTQVNFDFVYSKTKSRLDRGQPIFDATAGTNLNSTPISFAIGKRNDFENELNIYVTTSLQRKITDKITFNASYMKFLYDEDLLEHRTSNSYASDLAGNPIPTKMGMITQRRQAKNYNDNITLYFVSDLNTGPLKHKIVTGYDYILNINPVGNSSYNASGYRKTNGNVGNYDKNKPGDFIMENGNPKPNVPHFDLVNPDYSISEISGYINTSVAQAATKYYVNGIYLQDQISWGKFQALLGLRQEYYTDVLNYTKNNEKRVEQKALIPRVGLVYTPFDQVSFYGTYTEGYQPQVAGTIGAPEIYGGPFDPLISNMYEVGAKTEFFEKRLSANISFYRIEMNNVLAQLRLDPAKPDLYSNVGQQRSKGIELDINGSIMPNFSVTANFAISRAETTKSEKPENVGFLNANAPKAQGGLWAKYTFVNPDLKGLGLGAGVNYTGKRNTLSTLINGLELPEYTLFNAALYYSIDKFKLSANLNNVFNKTHWVGGYDFNRLYPGAPRNFMVGIGYTF